MHNNGPHHAPHRCTDTGPVCASGQYRAWRSGPRSTLGTRGVAVPPGRAVAAQHHGIAGGPAFRGQRQHRRGGLAHHRRLPRVCAHSHRRCHRGATPAGARGQPAGQNQPRPVCLRAQRHTLALRFGAQRLRCAVCVGWLQLGLSPCGGHRAGGLCAGHRHGGLGPCTRRAEQHRGPQALQGADQHTRRAARRAECGLRVHLRPHRGPGLPGAGSGHGLRRARPLFAPADAGHPAICPGVPLRRAANAGVLWRCPGRTGLCPGRRAAASPGRRGRASGHDPAVAGRRAAV